MSDITLGWLFGVWRFGSSEGANGGRVGLRHEDAPSRASVDEATFAGLRAGNPAVVESVYLSTYMDLCRFAYTVVRSSDAAHEIVQDTFVELLRRGAGLPSSGSVRGYLFRAVHNRALKALRHDHRTMGMEARAVREDVPPGHGTRDRLADEQLSREEELRALETALTQLPERQQRALFLRVSMRLGYAEIGQALDISADAARKLVDRGELELRRILAPLIR